MSLELTDHQKALLKRVVASGLYSTEKDALDAGLETLESEFDDLAVELQKRASSEEWISLSDLQADSEAHFAELESAIVDEK